MSGIGGLMSKVTIERRLTSEEKVSSGTPYASLFKDLILYAKEVDASDIHIEPTNDGVLIRMRLNGDLVDWKKLPLTHRQSFIQETKLLSNLSIAISNRPQDGRLFFPSWKLALRVSSIPMLYGEKIVLRLLDLSTSFDLNTSNIDKDCIKDLKKAINEKNGVIIISGPTGSGKTRTLYTLLNALEKSRKNIVTLEDPIEYTFDRINQIEINNKNLSFADGLRAILRQDPDVILVGEIRDFETADLCFKAAATGHLVFSTLHANSSVKAIDRLLNIGVEKYMIESNLRFSAAQRLCKNICPQCSMIPDDKTLRTLKTLFKERNLLVAFEKIRVRNLVGCGKCHQGVIGRVPILEYITKDELNFEDKLRPKRSLFESATRLAEKGVIDIREVFNVG